MRRPNPPFLAAASIAILVSLPAHAATMRADQILERFVNADQWRDNVMIVAHRGAAFANGEEVVAENSLAALDRAVSLGVDMVEIDIRKTADDVFVVSHDDTLDRATTCSGNVDAHTLAELGGCRLLSGPDRVATGEAIPTLTQFLKAAKGRIMINLDSKLGIEDAPAIFQIVRETGMTDYTIGTIPAHTPEDLAAAQALQQALGPDVQLLPNIYDSRIPGPEQIGLVYDMLDFQAMQVRNQYSGGPITEDGGVMFSAGALALAAENDSHLWINTLRNGASDPRDLRAGGRGDEYARTTGDLDAVYGFWARAGATMFQTDEPELAIGWLEENGYRIAYPDIEIAPIPLPATALLLPAALAGFGLFGRRRRA